MGSRSLWFTCLLLAACGSEDPVAPLQEDGDPATEEHEPPHELDAGMDGDAGEPPTPEPIAKVRVTPTSGLSTSEAGGTASFVVELTTEPTASVSIRVFSTAEREGVADRDELVFTPENWAPQTVTVTGQDDALLDGSARYQIVLDEAVSQDLRYQSVAVSDVTLVNVDDDAAGFTFVPGERTSTGEYGDPVTLGLRLNTRPSAPVVVTVTSDDASEGTVTSAALTFLPRDWDVPQEVVVDGVNDDEADGPQVYHVSVSAVASDDLDYVSLLGAQFELMNTDNDTAGITRSGIYDDSVREDDGSRLWFQLSTQPTSNVTVRCTSSDPAQLEVFPGSIYLSAYNWDRLDGFSLRTQDAYDDGDHEVTIRCAPSESSDPLYQGIAFEPLVVKVIDNDETALRATASGTTTCEAAGNCCSTITLRLGATPSSGDVVFAVTSSDPSEGVPSFGTVSLWSQASENSVRVCGVDDADDDGNVPYDITFTVQSSDDPRYRDLAPVTLSLINRDND